jgi:uncharacterized protein
MATTAFWRALYTAGHDAACLTETTEGWSLEGAAVYLKDGATAALSYHLSLAPTWETMTGSIRGRLGGAEVRHDIQRDDKGWLLNGRRQAGLEGVVDLDFGFTPATNFAQLKRMNLGIGSKAEISVAWMDVDSVGLEPLPQIYERLGQDTYDYNSPQGPYRAILELQSTGFVRLYPGLWQADDN